MALQTVQTERIHGIHAAIVGGIVLLHSMVSLFIGRSACCPLLETHFCWKTSQLNERGYLKIMYIANLMHVMLGNLGIDFYKWYNKKK